MPKPTQASSTGRTKDPALVAVGRQIRELREAKHIAQEKFAEKAEIDRSYYGSVERGERNVSTLNLIRIAAVLQVEVGALFPPLSLLKGATGATDD